MTELALPSRVQDLLHGEEQWWIQNLANSLERRVCVLMERQMRRTVVLETLSSLDDAELVALLAVVLERVEAGRGPSREVLQEMALEPVIFSDLSYERLKDAYSLARQEGLSQVAGFFLGDPLRLNRTLAEAQVGNQHLDLPLGVRRSAARSTDRNLIDRLLHDRNPRVVRLLLNNPRLIERDVIKMAANRPTEPKVLEEIAGHRRWSSRYRVRKALACNPYTPAPIARRLLPTLLQQDLAHVAGTRGLDPALKALAREILSSTSTRKRAGRRQEDA